MLNIDLCVGNERSRSDLLLFNAGIRTMAGIDTQLAEMEMQILQRSFFLRFCIRQ